MSRQTTQLMMCAHCVLQGLCFAFTSRSLFSFSITDQGWLLEYLSKYLFIRMSFVREYAFKRVESEITVITASDALNTNPKCGQYLTHAHSHISRAVAAIIGDGDRKCAPFLVLGLAPWYGTIFLFLEQIASSPAAHTRTLPRGFLRMSSRGNGDRDSRNLLYFWPTTHHVYVCWNFA